MRIGPLPDSSLRARRLGTIRRVVCASPDYLAARGRPERPEEVAGHDAIVFESLMADRWRFGEGASERRVRIRPRLRVNTAEAAIAAALEGLGLTAVLSYQVAEAVADGRLEVVLADFEPAP